MPVPKKLLIGMVTIFIAIAFSPIRFSICGWLMNEPFYANKPLSYWRHELLQWRIEYPGRPTGQQFFPQDVELAFEGNDFELVGGYSDLS